MTSGIHHVTLITRRVQANVDFYVGFLGLRLVKRTGGYEDGTQLHLIYGGAEGSPGIPPSATSTSTRRSYGNSGTTTAMLSV